MKNKQVEDVLKSYADDIYVPDVWNNIADAENDNGIEVVYRFKRKHLYKIVLVAAAIFLTAVIGFILVKPMLVENNKSISSKEQKEDYKEGDIYTIYSSTADFVSASPTLQKLFDDSDLVIQFTACNPEYCTAKGGMVITKFIPKIKETYKGKYDGNCIVSLGGIVDYDEYIKNDPDKGSPNKNFVSPKETPKPPKKIQLIFANIYVVHNGDNFIAFCKKNGAEYDVTNAFQGLFKISGGKIQNYALKEDRKILKDIKERINAECKVNIDDNTILKDGVDKKTFIDILKNFKN